MVPLHRHKPQLKASLKEREQVLCQHELGGNHSGRVICEAAIILSLSAVLWPMKVLSKVIVFSLRPVDHEEMISIDVFSLPLFVFVDLCAPLNRIHTHPSEHTHKHFSSDFYCTYYMFMRIFRNCLFVKRWFYLTLVFIICGEHFPWTKMV